MLLVVWGDPHPRLGSGGETRYALALTDGTGRVLSLRMTGQENVAVTYFNKPVVVSGRLAESASVAAGPGGVAAIVVDTIAPNPKPNATTHFTRAEVFGARRVIYLLVKFSDDASVPHPPNFYADLNNPDTPPAGETFPTTINGFFNKTSWNQFSWQGDVGGVGGVGAPGGWLALPHPKSYYAPCGWGATCADLISLAADATAAGKAQGITFSDYDNINFVLSNDLDCCAWGGGYILDGKVFGATWEPPWGQETGTYAHELGHSLGLPHSGWVYFAYDSPWDVMSNRAAPNIVDCGSYASANSGGSVDVFCSEPGDGYIVAHKDFLGWIPSANAVITDTLSNVTVTLEGGALPLAAAAKMIKICIAGVPCTGYNAHYLTVEARVAGLGAGSQFDNGIPGDGVIIHDVQMDRPPISGVCFVNSQSGWAMPIDSTPGDYDSVNCNFENLPYPDFALYNAEFVPGQTYRNGDYGLGISVVSRSGSAYVVSTYVRPTLSANAASQITTTGATLRGAVSSNGASSAVSFQFGRTSSYGTTVAADESPLAAGASNAAVSAAIMGLNCGTPYHFRVVAVNDAGTTNGPDTTFATTVCSGAELANLELSGSPLSPAFASSTLTYSASETSLGNTVTVTPTAADVTSTVAVNGAPVASGSPSGPITLSDGNNLITTVVTAQDGLTASTYTINVNFVRITCAYSLSPLDLSNTPAGGSNPTITVTTPAGCPVPATSYVPWVTVTGIAPGGDSATVALHVDANAGVARATSIMVADRLFLITQTGP